MVAYDVGRAVNPMMSEGQIVGGFAQGLGGALLRGIRLRRDRRAALGDLRRLSDADDARNAGRRNLLTEDAPSPRNPLGIKGAGEGGINGAGARDRIRHRRCHRHARRGHAAAGDAAADAGVVAACGAI